MNNNHRPADSRGSDDEQLESTTTIQLQVLPSTKCVYCEQDNFRGEQQRSAVILCYVSYTPLVYEIVENIVIVHYFIKGTGCATVVYLLPKCRVKQSHVLGEFMYGAL